jgi:hypothetical protein
MKPRTRAAHLGEITAGKTRYRVTYRNGWLQFRPFHCPLDPRGRQLALLDCFNLAAQQGSFSFIPKP